MPYTASLPMFSSFLVVGKSDPILTVIPPCVLVVVLLGVLPVPAPHAARKASMRGIPIERAKIRDQRLCIIILSPTKGASLYALQQLVRGITVVEKDLT